jgi:hypothetical protein
MHRRKFLLSASAFVIALKLPPSIPAHAAITPPEIIMGTDELWRIERAFNVLEKLKFEPLEQSRMLGVDLTLGANVKQVVTAQRTAVIIRAIERGDEETWKRIELIEDMQRLLVENLGPGSDVHRFWLSTEPQRENFKFGDRLKSGELRELQRTVVHLAFWPMMHA